MQDGAICSDGACGLHPEEPGCSEGALIGTWHRSEFDGKYLLLDCPDGYRLVNSTDLSSSGTFSHDRQACQKCPLSMYIIDDMFKCKPCQDGMICSGGRNVTALVLGAEFVSLGDTYWLASCPTGYSRLGFERSAMSSVSNSEIIHQNCIPCAFGEQCTDERCIRCKLCPPGTYKDVISPASCQPCPLVRRFCGFDN